MVMDTATPTHTVTTARGKLRLSLRLRLTLTFCTEDTMVMDSATATDTATPTHTDTMARGKLRLNPLLLLPLSATPSLTRPSPPPWRPTLLLPMPPSPLPLEATRPLPVTTVSRRELSMRFPPSLVPPLST